MSRSDSDSDIPLWDLIRYRGAVASAIRGRRGQAFLREMLVALDALPTARLIKNEMISSSGDVCALGAVGISRGLSIADIDPDDFVKIAKLFGVAPSLVREIVYENDENGGYWELTDGRWRRMRAWIESNIAAQN